MVEFTKASYFYNHSTFIFCNKH